MIPPEQARARRCPRRPSPPPHLHPPPLLATPRAAAAALTHFPSLTRPSQAGLATEQTHFYCLFAKKSRLLLTPSGDKDFYLLVTPCCCCSCTSPTSSDVHPFPVPFPTGFPPRFYRYVAYQFDVLARLYQWGVGHGWRVAHRPARPPTTTTTTASAAAPRPP